MNKENKIRFIFHDHNNDDYRKHVSVYR